MWNANHTQMLLTKAILKSLPALRSTKGDAIVQVKFYINSWTWFGTEYDPETGEMFGKVYSNACPDGELGYWNMNDLAQLHIPHAVERDYHFKPCPLSECKNPCAS